MIIAIISYYRPSKAYKFFFFLYLLVRYCAVHFNVKNLMIIPILYYYINNLLLKAILR